jgi:hypothetical protein
MIQEIIGNQRRNLGQAFVRIIIGGIIFFGLLGGLGRYGFIDDYSILLAKNNGSFPWSDYLKSGRPMASGIVWLIWYPIHSINEILLLHIFGICMTSVFAVFLYSFYLRHAINKSEAILMSTAPILLAPGFLIISSWAALSFATLGLLLTLASAFCVESSFKNRYALSTLILIAGFFTYQPTAMLFPLVPIIRYFLSSFSLDRLDLNTYREGTRKILGSYLVVFTISGFLSLIATKLMVGIYPATQRMRLIGPIKEKILSLMHGDLPLIISFLRPPFGKFPVMAWVCLAIVVAYLIWKTIASQSTFDVSLAVLGIGVCLMPKFLTGENWSSSRSVLGGQWFFASLTFVAILFFLRRATWGKPKLMQISVLILVIFSMYHSNTVLATEMRNPQVKELTAARSMVSLLNVNQVITVKSSSWLDSVAPWVSADEFGIPSSCELWVPVPLTKLLLREIYGARDFNVVMSNSLPKENSLDYSQVLKRAATL